MKLDYWYFRVSTQMRELWFTGRELIVVCERRQLAVSPQQCILKCKQQHVVMSVISRWRVAKNAMCGPHCCNMIMYCLHRSRTNVWSYNMAFLTYREMFHHMCVVHTAVIWSCTVYIEAEPVFEATTWHSWHIVKCSITWTLL